MCPDPQPYFMPLLRGMGVNSVMGSLKQMTGISYSYAAFCSSNKCISQYLLENSRRYNIFFFRKQKLLSKYYKFHDKTEQRDLDKQIYLFCRKKIKQINYLMQTLDKRMKQTRAAMCSTQGAPKKVSRDFVKCPDCGYILYWKRTKVGE